MVRKAQKIGGSYQAAGAVVAEFVTRAGEPRVVFEFDEPRGMLHIFNPSQIEYSEPAPCPQRAPGLPCVDLRRIPPTPLYCTFCSRPLL